MPTSSKLRVLHDAVLAGHPHAREQLIEDLLDSLTHRLRLRFPHADTHVLLTATHDALLDYSLRPHTFDPARNIDLERFIFYAAWRNVVDAFRSESRRKAREHIYALAKGRAALSPSATVGVAHTPAPPSQDCTRLRALVKEATDEPERRALELWIRGERHTQALATQLGLGELSPLEQRRGVKRFKDRVSKRLRRMVTEPRT